MSAEPPPGPRYRRSHTAPTQGSLDAFLQGKACASGGRGEDPPAHRASSRRRRRRTLEAAAKSSQGRRREQVTGRARLRQQPRKQQSPCDARRDEQRQQKEPQRKENRHSKPRSDKHQSRKDKEGGRRKQLEPEEDIVLVSAAQPSVLVDAGQPTVLVDSGRARPKNGIFASMPRRRKPSQGGTTKGERMHRPSSVPPIRKKRIDKKRIDKKGGSRNSESSDSDGGRKCYRIRRRSTAGTEPSTETAHERRRRPGPHPSQPRPGGEALLAMMEGLWQGREGASPPVQSGDGIKSGMRGNGRKGDDSSFDSSACRTASPEEKRDGQCVESNSAFDDSLDSCKTNPPASPVAAFVRNAGLMKTATARAKPKQHTKCADFHSDIVYVKDQLKQIKQQREIIHQRAEDEGITEAHTKGGSFHLDESGHEHELSSHRSCGFGNSSSMWISDLESLNLSDIEGLKGSSR